MQRLKNILYAKKYDPDSDERTKALDRVAEHERQKTKKIENLISARLLPPEDDGGRHGTRD